ncbi:hypothetical protein GLYMA_15G229100v4 [Glycine max]|uniref:Sulfotransferase n=1 Tax=Glycine max TaxID=3847 RepID=K7MDA4_SOYBN|nr:hypothetical protein GLYMA_15G229100v4 [Glycine max]
MDEQEKGWITPYLYLYQGFCVPKSGTTWLKALTFAIVHRQHFPSLENYPLLVFNPHERVPPFEFVIYDDINDQTHDLSKIPEPRIFGTHVPFTSLAKSIKESNCKIIYICRNLFDTFVSTWVFVNKIMPKDLDKPNKVMFLKYEDLKEDVNFNVKKIAEFLDCPFTKEEESSGVIENIIKLCSFEKMKELKVNKSRTMGKGTIVENKYFFWKAKIGDWVNYLSPSMVEKLS